MSTTTEEPKMAKKRTEPKSAPVDSGGQKTLKCSEATYLAVRRVANMRGIDLKDYVDETLQPIAIRHLREIARRIADEG